MPCSLLKASYPSKLTENLQTTSHSLLDPFHRPKFKQRSKRLKDVKDDLAGTILLSVAGRLLTDNLACSRIEELQGLTYACLRSLTAAAAQAAGSVHGAQL